MLPLFTLFLGATVVLDPGHGGYQPGAGKRGGFEKELTLEVAKAAKAELEKRGHTVFLTRTTDQYVSLGARSRFANEHAADVLVSIHANDAPRSKDASGIETYFLAQTATDADAQALAEKENDDPHAEPDDTGLLGRLLSDLKRTNAQIESELLAARLHGAMVRATGAKSRGVKQAPLAVLKRTEMAAVLVEVGFLSHKSEGPALFSDAYQQKLATGLADGIDRFLGDPSAPELPPASSAPLISLTDRQKHAPKAKAHAHGRKKVAGATKKPAKIAKKGAPAKKHIAKKAAPAKKIARRAPSHSAR
jgi:N-acetylmuramoyl-L-alanine amidase